MVRQTQDGLSTLFDGDVAVAGVLQGALDVVQVLGHQRRIRRRSIRVHVEFELQRTASMKRQNERTGRGRRATPRSRRRRRRRLPVLCLPAGTVVGVVGVTVAPVERKRRARRVEVGHQTLHVAVADVEATSGLRILQDLVQDHRHGHAVVVGFSDDGDDSLLQRRVFRLLRNLNKSSAFVLQLFDERPSFADDHAGRRVGNQHLDLLLSLGRDLVVKVDGRLGVGIRFLPNLLHHKVQDHGDGIQGPGDQTNPLIRSLKKGPKFRKSKLGKFPLFSKNFLKLLAQIVVKPS